VRRSLLATFILARAVWAQEVNFFANKVYPVLEEARCRLCHTTAGVASGTRVHFPEKDATQNQIQLFGLSLSAVVDRSNLPNSLLALKPTNKTKHTGGERIKPGSGQERSYSSGFSIWRALLRSCSRRSKSGSTKRRLRPTRRIWFAG
jgi:hypothetical protein